MPKVYCIECRYSKKMEIGHKWEYCWNPYSYGKKRTNDKELNKTGECSYYRPKPKKKTLEKIKEFLNLK